MLAQGLLPTPLTGGSAEPPSSSHPGETASPRAKLSQGLMWLLLHLPGLWNPWPSRVLSAKCPEPFTSKRPSAQANTVLRAAWDLLKPVTGTLSISRGLRFGKPTNFRIVFLPPFHPDASSWTTPCPHTLCAHRRLFCNGVYTPARQRELDHLLDPPEHEQTQGHAEVSLCPLPPSPPWAPGRQALPPYLQNTRRNTQTRAHPGARGYSGP